MHGEILTLVNSLRGMTFLAGCLEWAIPDKLCPPPIEDVSDTYAKSLELHLLFYKYFLEIQSEKMK